jgi:hypothetical protein
MGNKYVVNSLEDFMSPIIILSESPKYTKTPIRQVDWRVGVFVFISKIIRDLFNWFFSIF